MIDFHSHILPGIDDGSKHTEESLSLLKQLAEQGVDTVVATPHFYADREKSVESFLARRDAALAQLAPYLTDDLPAIRCGAEVLYYPGISRLPDIKALRVADSRLLLLEMPVSRWTEYTVKELVELAGGGKTTLVLAHMERYMGYQKADVLSRLYEAGILMQVNARFFTQWRTRRKALSMLAGGELHLLGSDCHNLTSRPPRLGEAFAEIRRKYGEEFLTQMNEYGYSLLAK